MQSSLEEIRERLRLVFALVKMRNLEALLASEAPKVSELTDIPKAKETFNRWARDSEDRCKACQHMIDRLQGSILQSERSDSVEVSFDSPRVETNIFEIFPELKENKLTARVLYYLAEKHLILEGDAERRYGEMTRMAKDQGIRKMLLDLSRAEQDHHRDAQMLVEVLKKTLADKK